MRTSAVAVLSGCACGGAGAGVAVVGGPIEGRQAGAATHSNIQTSGPYNDETERIDIAPNNGEGKREARRLIDREASERESRAWERVAHL
jgi:hypothetical protein